jgi:hypothetical protein
MMLMRERGFSRWGTEDFGAYFSFSDWRAPQWLKPKVIDALTAGLKACSTQWYWDAMKSKQPLAIVTDQLKTYARRGVFRSFSQTGADSKRADFRFYWLWNLPFHLTFDGKRKSLSFKNLLPGVPAGSELNTGLKAFIKSRSANDQPEHRRLDPKRVSVRYSNLRGNVSITFLVAKDEYEYGVKKALNLVNEIFVDFLNVRFPEYTAEYFHKRED